MTPNSPIHPDTVREAIAATAVHPAKRRNLDLIHQVCQERQKTGSKDFSLRSIGEAVEARGGLTAKALSNPQSLDYRHLIEAWRTYSGSGAQKMAAEDDSADRLTRNIGDAATRIVVMQLMRERDKLRGEVNILKSQTKLVIDKRPTSPPTEVPLTPDGTMTLQVPAVPALNALERESLAHAVSSELFRAEGWSEEKNGRVVRDLGGGRTRTVFKPGFTTAVRKLLG